MKNFQCAPSILVYFLFLSSTYAAVNITINGLAVQIKNDLAEFNFNKYAQLSTLYVNGVSLASKREKTFYLDWSVGHQVMFVPDSVHIVEQSSSIVHFYWLEESPKEGFTSELHYIMEDGTTGIYCYVKYTNNKSANVSLGLSRIVYRFDETILHQAVNPERRGALPTAQDFINATDVIDATVQFANGTYFSKYDWVSYSRETYYYGVYGNGFGAFSVHPSKEYHDDGPMKQGIYVQQMSLMSASLTGNHFEITEGLNAPPGWTHVYGPWLLYFPIGNSDDEILAAAEKQLAVEQKRWPYSFVKDEEYPLERGSISGYVNGQKSAQVVVYDSLNEYHEHQKLGYMFTTKTDSNGYYFIDKIRPGLHRVAAYPLAGQGVENEAGDLVNITAGNLAQVNLTLPEPENIIWSVGEANRRASEFKYADEIRNYKWHLITPQNITFTIGESDPKNDWYYAQPASDSFWQIKYNDTNDGKSRTLRVALAATYSSHIYARINGHQVGSWGHQNDHSIYRCARQSGEYFYNIATVPAKIVKNGENTLELNKVKGQVMYDAISLQRND